MNDKVKKINDDIELSSIYFKDEGCLEITILTPINEEFRAGQVITTSYTVSTVKTIPIIHTTHHYTLSILSWITAMTDDNRKSAVVKCKILNHSVEGGLPTKKH